MTYRYHDTDRDRVITLGTRLPRVESDPRFVRLEDVESDEGDETDTPPPPADAERLLDAEGY